MALRNRGSSKAINVSNEEITAYYLDPQIQIIHICLSIARYQKDLASLAIDLKIPASKVSAAINKLEQMKLISRSKDGVRLLVDNLHLPKQSPVYKSWRNQLKLLSIGRLDSIADDDAYSFSVVFSANDDIRREIHGRFLSYLKNIEELVSHGPQEDTYQMSFELFSWTKPEKRGGNLGVENRPGGFGDLKG